MNSERDSLSAAVDRLETLTESLSDREVGLDERSVIAGEALTASAEITELLPRLIREIEDATTGGSRAEGPAAGDKGE